jgi:hypothetical protein
MVLIIYSDNKEEVKIFTGMFWKRWEDYLWYVRIQTPVISAIYITILLMTTQTSYLSEGCFLNELSTKKGALIFKHSVCPDTFVYGVGQ